VHRYQFHTRTEARIKIATWVTDFYNHRRRQSVCDGLSPIDYERSTARALEVQAAQRWCSPGLTESSWLAHATDRVSGWSRRHP
jgi:hypothetical protein